jgi:type III restriction enzyme
MPPRSSKPSAQGAMLPGIAPIFSKVIINDAYTEPTQHLNLLRNTPASPSASKAAVPAGYFRTDANGQEVFEEMVSVNRLRDRLRVVARRRATRARRTSPRALLRQWNSPDREGLRQFFCQREAAEAIIWLTEGPSEPAQPTSTSARPTPSVRYCCKLATGAGKTTVMAMLIAWTVLNRVYARATRASPTRCWWCAPTSR